MLVNNPVLSPQLASAQAEDLETTMKALFVLVAFVFVGMAAPAPSIGDFTLGPRILP